MDESRSENIPPEAAPGPEAQEMESKQVKFPEELEELAQTVEEVINREDLTDEDRAALWFSTDDYVVLKQEARQQSMACEREGQSKGLLDRVFSEKSRDAQDKLNQWVQSSPARRGLERTANQQLGDARQQAQFQAVMDVLSAQDEMLILKGEVDVEEVKKVSHKATRTARHFARMMAKADALAAGIEVVANVQELSPEDSNSTRRIHSTKSKSPSKTSSTSSESPSRTSKEKKEVKKARRKQKEVQQKARDKEEKQKAKEKAKEEKLKAKEKRKDKEREEPKRKTSFKKKFQETKAGILARIPRRIA